MMKRLLIIMVVALAFVENVGAIPAYHKPIEHTQPDGSVISVIMRGDEQRHYCFTDDGYLLMNVNDAFYYGNIGEDGALVSSGIMAKQKNLRTVEDRAYLSRVDMNTVRDRMRQTTDAPAGALRTPGVGLMPGSAYPCFGEPKGLVILVEYSDVKFTVENPREYYTRMLQEKGFSDYEATGSARDYYIECSNGLFRPQFDVYGPVELPEKRSYYGANDALGVDEHPEMMPIHACELMDGEIDFSQYDCDGDGFIDSVYIFYAGEGEATGGPAASVWPQSWYVTKYYSTPFIYDGVQLDKYACSNEWEKYVVDNAPSGIGAFCHEFAHVLGLPDLYTTAYVEGAFTPGAWSALDLGPYNNCMRTPPLFTAFERNALGWMIPLSISGAMSCELQPMEQNVAFEIETDNSGEFFLFENRQQIGWDAYIPGHGMLVWHICYNAKLWKNNTVNNDPNFQYVDVVEADGIATDASRHGDTFPGTAGVTSFTDTTTPAMLSSTGTPLGLPITDITEKDGVIYFDVCGGGMTVVAGGSACDPGETPYDPERPLTFDRRQVDMLDASEIKANSFTANWLPMDEAMTYMLSVYSHGNARCSAETVDFEKGVKNLPEGWSTSCTQIYNTAKNSGMAPPAAKMTKNGDYIQSKTYGSDIYRISLWHKYNPGGEGNRLLITIGEETTAIDLSAESEGLLEVFANGVGARQVRIEFECSSDGALAIDDIKVEYNVRYDRVPVEGAVYGEVMPHDGILSVDVTGLQPRTTYYYSVTASNGSLLSKPSDELSVTMADESAIDAVSNDNNICVGNGFVYSENPIDIYTIDGKCVMRHCRGTTMLNSGIYIIDKLNGQSMKLTLK